MGKDVYIGDHCTLYGEIIIEDFVYIGPGVRIFSVIDDSTGPYLAGPLNPDWSRKIIEGKVIIGKGAIIGANSVILPGTTIGRGCAIGPLSVAQGHFREFCVYAGNPATFRETRGSNHFEKLLEKREVE